MNTATESGIEHYHTAGQAILGMGVLSATLAAATVLTGTEMGFIGPGAMATIAGIFAAVGAIMMRVGSGRDA